MHRPFDGRSGSQRGHRRTNGHRAELDSLPLQQGWVGRRCPGRPGTELCVDPGTDLTVELVQERLHDGVLVIGTELVMDLGRGADLLSGESLESPMLGA